MIDTKMLDALGDNWMVRTDNDGVSYKSFRWAPVGEWTECPRWNENTKADCVSGGLFGQGPGGYGYAQTGTRFVVCETGPERMSVDGNKIKVRRASILYAGQDALDAMVYMCDGKWPGSLIIPVGASFTAPVLAKAGHVDVREGASFTAPKLNRSPA